MLSLVIPGPKSPGKDMDVFLRPLVEELKQLWHSGVRTKDALTNEFFNMKAVLLWTINDFPARSSLSTWRNNKKESGNEESDKEDWHQYDMFFKGVRTKVPLIPGNFGDIV
ncbi:hypothetical protein OSB04_011063 [Centaurea solstitialis]|uniref:Uncharacterized protein n=1 Tax=Centaurea solstitialis TaxID=347529 RepID=A0AA38TAF7_9ASTR|nr:hypothetical protein OSB04_011063 [Centaurea solstitialis]